MRFSLSNETITILGHSYLKETVLKIFFLINSIHEKMFLNFVELIKKES
jgi:hypothetical protein